mgnify:FL=1
MSSQVTNLLFLILPWVIIITLIAVAIWLVRWFIRNDREKTKDR